MTAAAQPEGHAMIQADARLAALRTMNASILQNIPVLTTPRYLDIQTLIYA